MAKRKKRRNKNKKPHWSTALKPTKNNNPNQLLKGNRKEWLPKTSLGRGYGSKSQDRRAAQLTKEANKNPDKLLTADELLAEMKRKEQEAIKARFA